MYKFEDALGLEIGEVHEIYRNFSNKKLPEIYKKFGFGQEIIDKAQGSYLETRSGRKILDLTGGLGVANFGHNHPRVMNVRRKFCEDMRPEIHKSYFNPILAAASFNLAKVLGHGLTYSFFCNSGAESIDGALKITYKRHQGRRKYVLHSDRSFHGKTIGAGSLSAGDNFVGGKSRFFFQKIPGVIQYNFNSFESIKEECDRVRPENVYAIFIEPFSCSTLTPCDQQFLKKVRAYCHQHKISLVFDEIYSGFAKCGYDFYFHKYGIVPDVICLSKALGGGKASISAYVSNEAVHSEAYGTIGGALTHSTTYNSFGEECVTVLECCNILVDERVAENALKIEAYLKDELGALCDDSEIPVTEVRGAGSHFGIILESKLDVFQEAVKLLPIDFTSDPLFMKKLVTTAIANDLWKNANILTAFTSNIDVILNISPAPITDINVLKDYLPGLKKTLKRNMVSMIAEVIKNGLVKL